jgi:rhodanese-related sulfurtransferase
MESGTPEISVREAKRLLESPQPPRLIDVREADEWKICHVPGAEHLPLSQWPELAQQKLSDVAEPLLILCHHGTRSAHAVEFLRRRGFANVTNVAGGIDAWSVEIDPMLARY